MYHLEYNLLNGIALTFLKGACSKPLIASASDDLSTQTILNIVQYDICHLFYLLLNVIGKSFIFVS